MIRAARRLLLLVLTACAFASTGAAAQTVVLPVPLATIYPGDPIGAGSLGERSFLQTQIGAGFVDSRGALIGKIARRTLLPNHPIAINAIGDMSIVNRGTPVQLVFRQTGLLITAFAMPLQDGGPGDLIRVRNADSGTIVMGVVQPDGTVRVGPQ